MLFEEEILIFELVAFEGGGLQCLLGLVVEGHVLLFLLGLLLEPLDEGEDLLLLLGGQVVQNSNPFASRHLNYTVVYQHNHHHPAAFCSLTLLCS